MKKNISFVLALIFSTPVPVFAEINIGVIASLTGPAASLGIETKKVISMFPDELEGEKINYFILDDQSDPTSAVNNARKLISDKKVDVIIGPNLIVSAMAIADLANEEKTPMVSIAPLDVSGDRRRYIFRSEPSADIMVNRVVDDMLENGIKKIGFIGFSDSWGELLLNALISSSKGKLEIVGVERYNRSDASVMAQVLKLILAKPEAIFVGASGTPAALPQLTLVGRGYKGKIYHSHGVTNKEFIRVGGKSVEGALIPVGPVLVAEQLPDDHPNKKNAISFVHELESRNGPDSRSTFAGASWDAWLLTQRGLLYAIKSNARPGTLEFRNAVRDGIEKTGRLIGVNGVYNMSDNDHAGYDPSVIVLVSVHNGRWKLVKW